jgi:hypothetical protein
MVSPIDQLYSTLVNVDGRIATIPRSIFLDKMIAIATDEGITLQL